MSSVIIGSVICVASLIIIVDAYVSYSRKWGENE